MNPTSELLLHTILCILNVLVQDRSSGNIHIVPTSYILSALYFIPLCNFIRSHFLLNIERITQSLIDQQNRVGVMRKYIVYTVFASFFPTLWHRTNQGAYSWRNYILTFDNQSTPIDWITGKFQHELKSCQFWLYLKDKPFPRIKIYYSHF